MVTITNTDRERFVELADVTLRRTNQAYFYDEYGRVVSWLVFGAVPLIGLVWLDWSASSWLLFLLIGAWTGIVCDVFKLHFLYEQVVKTADAIYENNFVWTMVEAMREGKEVAPRDHQRAKYEPRGGFIIDLVFGAIGTVMVLVLFPGDLIDGIGKNATVIWGISGFVVYRVALTAWEIVEQRNPGTENRRVRLAVGLRGVGLFVFGFLIGMLVGDESKPNFSSDTVAWWAMLIVNSLCILASILAI